MKRIGVYVSAALVLLLSWGCAAATQPPRRPPPILDMHLHAHKLSMYGTPPPAVCTNDQDIILPGIDPQDSWTHERLKSCRARLRAPGTDEELLRTTLEMLERYNIRAVTTGPLEEVSKWRAAAPSRIIPAVPFDDYERRAPEAWRRLFAKGSSQCSQRSALNTMG